MEDYRLDVYLQTNKFTETREKAKNLILNNCVYVNEKLITKPSFKVNELDKVDVKNDFIYVSRGASKLEKAIKYFNIVTKDKTAVDIGASTGGFTDYLIKNQAKKVYAVDVGHNQLHASLLINEKVINMEKTNFRYIDTEMFKESIDIITVDVSFISLSLILPNIGKISNENTDIIILIKPQFEAGRENIGKNGIVKDKKIHLSVLRNVQVYCAENGLYLGNITYSPIKGGDGNIEYLALLKKGIGEILLTENKFKDLIEQAFEYYKKLK